MVSAYVCVIAVWPRRVCVVQGMCVEAGHAYVVVACVRVVMVGHVFVDAACVCGQRMCV